VPSAFTTSRRVEFRDTDAAGIAHFTALLAYMEEAEHAFLRHVGLSVHADGPSGIMSWPRASLQCDFEGAAKFEEVVDIAVRIQRLGRTSVTYGFELSHQGRSVAQGTMTSVCCQIQKGKSPEPVPIPEPIRKKLEPYVDATR